MPPAVIAGGVAAVGAIGGAVIGSKAQKSAANQAAASQNQAAQLQYQLGQQQLALQQQLANQSLGFAQDVYGANWSVLSPYVSQGNVAGQYYNALLGLPAAPAIPNPLGSSGGSTGGSPAPAPAPSSPPAATPPAVPTLPPAQTTQPVSQTPLPSAAPPSANPVVGNSGTVAVNPNATSIFQPGALMGVNDTAVTMGSDAAGLPYGGTAPLGTGQQSQAQQGALLQGEPPTLPTMGPGSINASSAPGEVAGAGANTIGGGTYAPPPAPALGTTPASSPPAAPPPAAPPPATGGTPAPSAPPVDPVTAQQAFQTFLDSAGYQFTLGQAMNSINYAAAGGGWLQSGAALKALQDRAADVALQGYFMPYMGMLGGQQALGAQAASSIAGVGSNFTNSAANINNAYGANSADISGNMGNALQSGANATSNAAIAAGMANANMWSGVGSALGSLGSSFANSYGSQSGPAYGTGLGYDPISGASYGFGW